MKRRQDELSANETKDEQGNANALTGEAPSEPDDTEAGEYIATEETEPAGDSGSRRAEPAAHDDE